MTIVAIAENADRPSHQHFFSEEAIDALSGLLLAALVDDACN
jgi:hypothetical protein